MFDKAVLALPGARRMLALSCVLALARALCVVGQALALAGFVVDAWGGAALTVAWPLLAAFFVCFVMRQVLLAAQDAGLARFAAARADDLRQDALRAVFTLGPAVVQSRGSSAVVADVVEGAESVETYLALVISKVTAVVVVPCVLLLAIFPLDWVSGVIALVCYPFIILYMVMIGYTAGDAAAKRHGEFQVMSNHFIDSLRGIDTLRAFGRAREHGQRIFAVSEKFREATMKTLRIATLSSAVLDTFATLALAAVAIMLGFRLVDGSLAFFPALAVLVMVPEYFRPIREFAADYHATLDGKTALASLQELIAEGCDASGGGRGGTVQSLEQSCSHESATGAFGSCGTRFVNHAAAPASEGDAVASAGGEPLGGGMPCSNSPARANSPLGCSARAELRAACPLPEALEVDNTAGVTLSFEGVSFSYPSRENVLADVSFSVSSPCKVGVIGASGSGKSTLLSLIGGFADPTGGVVRAGGVAVPTLRNASWQRRATLIPQDPYIFHASLRDNVAFYCPDAPEERVRRAVELAGLTSLAASLPQGFDEPIGAGGRELSGGEKQRVALARAFLDASRDVLLFDEPTARLDIETEYELKERMLPAMEGRLVFFATHRLHWVADMDYVLVLDGGRVAWQGTPSEMAAANLAVLEGGALR